MNNKKTQESVIFRLPAEFKVRLKTEAAKKGFPSMSEYARFLTKNNEDLEDLFKPRMKKANLGLNTVMILVTLFVMAFVAVIGFSIFSSINADLQADPDIQNITKVELSQTVTGYPGLFDSIYVLVLVLMWVGLVVTAFFSSEHPILFVVSILIMIFVIIVGAMLTNIYEEISGDPALTTAADSFPMTNFIIGKLPIVLLVVVVSIALALYGQNRFAGG